MPACRRGNTRWCSPLSAAIRELALSRGYFDRLIDARERDLADAPPASLGVLEAYAEESSAPLIYLALEVLGIRSAVPDAVARHVGIGYALGGLLRAMPFHAQAGRTYIPVDIAEQKGLHPGDYAGGRAGRPCARWCVPLPTPQTSFVCRPRGSRRDTAIGACRIIAGGYRQPPSRAVAAGCVRPLDARASPPRPAADLAPGSGRTARPVLI